MNNKIKLSRNKINQIHSTRVVKIISVLVLMIITLLNNNLNAACNSKDGNRTEIQATIKAQIKDESGKWHDTKYAPIGIEVKWVCEVSATSSGQQLLNITYKWSGANTSGTAKECTSITYTTLGEMKPKCEVTAKPWQGEDCELKGSSAPEGSLKIYKVKEMTKLSFSNNHDLCTDDGATTYSSPHWKQSSNKPHPIAFTRNTKYKAEVEMTLTESVDASQIDFLRIKAEGLNGLNINTTKPTLSGNTIKIDATAVKSFPDTVKYYKEFKLKWKISYDSGTSWNDVTTTSCECYVTLNDPSCSNNYHSLFHIACKKASDKSTNDSVFTSIWTYIKALATETYSGAPLHYYGVPSNIVPVTSLIKPNLGSKARELNNPTISQLLTYSDGKCGTWSYFLKEICSVHSLAVGTPSVLIDTSRISDPTSVPTGYQLHPQALFKVADYPGQNINLPLERIWGDHQFNSYKGKFYDPSYGSEYGDKKTNSGRSIISYGRLIYKLDNSGKITELKYLETETATMLDYKIK